MKRILLKIKISAILLFFAFSYTNVNAQCSITTTTNASVVTCGGTAPLSSCNGIVYIGDGTNAMSLLMNSDLNLTCLGAIQFIVRNNAALDFDAGNNKDLILAAGSSIQFESNSSIIISVGNCSGSDRITIGGAPIAACNGGSAPFTFAEIVNQGGYSPINATANPATICSSGSSTITATATPSGATYKWYTIASGGSPSYTGNPFSTGAITTTTTYYVEASYTSPTYTTIRKPVTVTVNPISAIVLTSGTQNPIVCAGTAITNTVYTYSGSATNASVSGLPAGLSQSVNTTNKTVTISGTPTAGGTYTITTSGHTAPCTAATISGTVTVNPISAIVLTSGTQNPIVCAGTAITNTVYTYSGSATNASVSGLPAGLSQSVNTTNKTVTISGTPTAGGTYTITTSGHTAPCTAAAISGTVTVNPISAIVLTSGTQNPIVCAGTAITNTVYTYSGSATNASVSGLPAGLSQSVDTTNKTVTISGTPTAGGTYTITTSGHTAPCTAAAISGTVIVNPISAIVLTSGTQNPIVCAGTAITNTVYTYSGSATNASVSGLPAGLSQSVNTTDKTVTISGTPTAGGTYTITTSGHTTPCIAATISGTITLNNVSVPTGLASQSFCSSTSPTVANLTAAGSGILWYLNPNGGVPLATSTGLINGNHYYASQTVSGCESSSRLDVTLILNSVPNPPVVPSALSLNCDASSFIASWTASANATKYFLDIATDAGFTNILAPYNNLDLGNVVSTTITTLPLAASFYLRLRADNGCGNSLSSTVSTVSLPVTTTTDGTSWSNGAPNSTKKVVFLSGGTIAPITTELTACSCQIGPGVNIKVGLPNNVNTNAILNIANGLEVDPTSTLTFENNASLVQVNDAAVNSGNIIYKRTTSAMKKYDYTYWSSPVADQKLNVLSPNSAGFYYSFDKDNWVKESGGATMNDAGKGFIIRVPNPNVTYPNSEGWSGPTYRQPVQFVGVPYNGIKTIVTQGALQNNLIGNPYPSAILADDFIDENETIIGGALYFWTHNTARAHVGTQYVYVSDDYATYTLAGGTGTDPALSGGVAPSGYIAAGQAFFVRSKTDGSFEFNNSMRVSDPGRNSDFFKMGNTKKVAATAKVREKNRVWLNLSNAGGAFKQLLVGYIEGATDEVDNLYDGVTYDGNTYIDFYSINSEKKLTVQGRGLPFKETDRVPLGYKTNIGGTFDISIDHVDGIMANKMVYLEDKTTGVTHNLNQGTYSFSTQKGEFQDRFVLSYASSSLGTDDFEGNGKSLVVSVKQHQIKINSFDETLSMVKVYDLRGRLLYKNDQLNGNEFTIPNFNSGDQFLIVMTQLTNGKWITKEIIF